MPWTPSADADAFALLFIDYLADAGIIAQPATPPKALYDALVSIYSAAGGVVNSVSGTAPITSTGGANPVIGIAYAVSSKNANFVAALGNHYEVDTTGGDVTCTLPAATAGRDLTVAISAGANKVNFTGTVNGDAAAYIQTAHSCVTLRGLGGTSWRVV